MRQHQQRGVGEAGRSDGGGAGEAAAGKRTLTESMADAPQAAAPAPRMPTTLQAESGGPVPGPAAIGGGDGDGEGGVLGGEATNMSTGDLAAATWSDHGQFKWWIKWVTDGTEGWIVQKITNTYSGTKKDGTAITNASVGAVAAYYEAWEVDKAGGITGSLGKTGNRDRWERPALGEGSKGSWSMTGNVYWTASDPAKSGMTSGGVKNAGSLLSSTSAPKDLSAELLTRTANGVWDSTGKAPTHAGKAK